MNHWLQLLGSPVEVKGARMVYGPASLRESEFERSQRRAWAERLAVQRSEQRKGVAIGRAN